MIMPGVQMPHCAPPCSTNARCSGWRPLKPFNRRHAGAGHLRDGDQAGIDRRAVDQHGAGAALAFSAAFLRPGERAVFAQHVEQTLERMRAEVRAFAVQSEAHRGGEERKGRKRFLPQRHRDTELHGSAAGPRCGPAGAAGSDGSANRIAVPRLTDPSETGRARRVATPPNRSVSRSAAFAPAEPKLDGCEPSEGWGSAVNVSVPLCLCG